MHENRPSKLWEIFAVGLVLCLVTVRAWYWFAKEPAATAPPVRQLAAGEVVDGFGTYLSPHAISRVRIEPTTPGNWSINVAANNPREIPSGEMKFNHSSWFGTWDDQDRFWLCLPGKSVYRYTENGTRSETMHSGEAGGWDDVPQTFIDRLPESEKRKYEQWIASQK